MLIYYTDQYQHSNNWKQVALKNFISLTLDVQNSSTLDIGDAKCTANMEVMLVVMTTGASSTA